ncbi:hypothetical protein BS47DRAFT_1307930 [Hydnum rufescens UP504]|uniref:Uncharacterized protein n=1 Tax=Hydnum rufescens UP504 TaxID=1448309 RepID=A0A9P6DNG7_9AGAM|nr:hypothetical protein BS47DRAFT_1307930 [Hydnum rufescens UP504]
MDYILFSGLQGTTLHDHLNTYDIWCMYHKNLHIRHLQLPSMLQFDFDSVTLNGAVPKFHLNAHGDSCRTVFSLNFFPGVSHMDGEGIECDWASINGAAQSTKDVSSVKFSQWQGRPSSYLSRRFCTLSSLNPSLPFSFLLFPFRHQNRWKASPTGSLVLPRV